MLCEPTDAGFQAQHLVALYESVVDMNNRLNMLEQLHQAPDNPAWSLSQSENQHWRKACLLAYSLPFIYEKAEFSLEKQKISNLLT